MFKKIIFLKNNYFIVLFKNFLFYIKKVLLFFYPVNTGLLLIGNIVCICVIYSEETVERSATRLSMKDIERYVY